MSLIEVLQSQLGDDGLAQLAGQIGADPSAVSSAMPAAVAVLTGQMSKNASQGGGAEALLGALTRDHDGSILDNVGAFLGQGDAARSMGGAILGHVFGQRSTGAAAGVSKASGLDSKQAGNLLTLLAPLVMGLLGKQQRGGGLDLGSLAGMLAGASNQAKAKAPESAGGILGKMLDADGDGSFMDELTEIGGGLLGGFLKK